MAISKFVMDEIRRKAQSGEALSVPTKEKQAVYDYYKQNPSAIAGGQIADTTMNEIIRKAQSGIPLDKPTGEKMAIYNAHKPKEFDLESYMKQFTDQINNMYNQQREAKLAQLRASRDKAIRQINQQKEEVAPKYQGMRNQTDATNLQNVQKLREVMAANGLNATGENVTAQTNMANQRLNSINSLNLQEQQTNNDLNRRITDLNNPDTENELIAALEAERSRALLDLGMQADQNVYNRNRDSLNDTLRNREWYYNVDRNEKLDNRYFDERDYQRQQDAKEWEWRQYTYNNMSASEKAQMEWNKRQFGEEMAWRMYEMEYNGDLQKSINDSQLNFYNSGFPDEGEGGARPQSYQTHLNEAVKKYGIPTNALPYINWIIQRESSFNPTAKNPKSSAYGYGQFINSTRQGYEKKYGVSYNDPVNQIYLTYRYMVDRYGSPQKAVEFWKKNNWY